MSAAGPPPPRIAAAAAALLLRRRPSPAPAWALLSLSCPVARRRAHPLRSAAPAAVVPAPLRSSCPPARRRLSSARPAREAAALRSPAVRDVPDGAAAEPAAPGGEAPLEMYRGSMRTSVRSLKIFSSSSLVVSVASIPVVLLADVSMPVSARCWFLLAAVGSSAVSSFAVHWWMSSYVISIFMNESSLRRLEAHPQPSQLCPPQSSLSSPGPPPPDPPIFADFRTLKFFGGVRRNIVRTDRLVRSDKAFTNYAIEEAPGRMRYFMIHGDGVYPAGLRKVLGLRDSRNVT